MGIRFSVSVRRKDPDEAQGAEAVKAGVRLSANVRPQGSHSRRTPWLLVLLIAGMLWFLGSHFNYARYALTGILWERTTGTVTIARDDSHPTIRFESEDGVSHSFSENYQWLCGGWHTLCSVRSFSQGEVVPVVYDSARPERAFIRDWALFVQILYWLFALGITFLLTIALIFVLTKTRAMSLSIGMGKMGTDEQINDNGS